MTGSQATIHYIETDLPVSDLDNVVWQHADPVTISSYWNGSTAPKGRWVEARLMWSDWALYVRFEAVQEEPLVVNDQPVITTKTIGLWKRDVCEIFIAPDAVHRNRYFEFEIAPTNEWLDLEINSMPDGRETDWEYSSGMEAASRIDSGRVVMAIKMPWKAFGKTPGIGEVWAGNLFRCVGSRETRGYLAWQPTMTDTPNFHVPERFGRLVFIR